MIETRLITSITIFLTSENSKRCLIELTNDGLDCPYVLSSHFFTFNVFDVSQSLPLLLLNDAERGIGDRIDAREAVIDIIAVSASFSISTCLTDQQTIPNSSKDFNPKLLKNKRKWLESPLIELNPHFNLLSFWLFLNSSPIKLFRVSSIFFTILVGWVELVCWDVGKLSDLPRSMRTLMRDVACPSS